jgi:hypothetical protein
MARPYHYHVWHRSAFDPLPAWASSSITVPKMSGAGTETRTVYSLKKDMDQLRADGKTKGIVDDSVKSVGTSWGDGGPGKELWALKLGKDPAHKVLFTGCHHSREWISVEIPYLVAEYLIQNYVDPPTNDKEKRIKHLIMNREIWFVPMVNPDGHEFSTINNRNWRANRKAYTLPANSFSVPALPRPITSLTRSGTTAKATVPSGEAPSTGDSVTISGASPAGYNGTVTVATATNTTFTYTVAGGLATPATGTILFVRDPRLITHAAGVFTGVDINRNYAAAAWGRETFKDAGVRTSRDPQDGGENSIWCGPSGSSEKETKAIDDLFKAHRFRASITYHNFSQLLLFPDAASGDTFVQDVGKGMAQLIAEKGNPYTYQSSAALYPTTGSLMAFSYEASPGRPTYTPELRPKDSAPPDQFFSGLDESEIEPCFKENLAAALALINCAGHNSAPSGTTSCKPRFGIPPWTCQVVLNCWEVFKGWTP